MRRHQTRGKQIRENLKKKDHWKKLVERGRVKGMTASVVNGKPEQEVPLSRIGIGPFPKIGADTLERLGRGHNVTAGRWLFLLDTPDQASQVFSFSIIADPHNEFGGRRIIGRFKVDLEKKTISRQ